MVLKNALESSMFQNIFSNFSLNFCNDCYREDPITKAGVLRSSDRGLLDVFPFSNRLKEQQPGGSHRNNAQKCSKYSEPLQC